MNAEAKIDNWNLYDPNWEETFNHYMNAHTALMNDGQENDEEKTAKLKEYERGFKDAHMQQFKNGSEYADFMISYLKLKSQMNKLVWMEFDTSEIKTPEEANTLFLQLSDFLDSQIKEQRNSIPVSDKMGIFNPENTESHYAYFTKLGTETVVTAEKQNGKMNICLTQLKSNQGVSVVNGIENLANGIYAQSLANQGLGLDDINWYIHIPADVALAKEKFMHVTMSTRDGRFVNADFGNLEAVPSSIKKARFNAAKGDMDLSEAEQKTLGYSRPLLNALIL